ncbi:hypothetical protein PRZ48_007228 [Zasmidium cellare]|uniref:Uncharacterized protein n=1 Tax=Zasmidium cellare TaxID=395010 RepID=A0ABR0EJ68_ZASCE|nr:hypothetical protein PRZ48_007228 [Zasmidium cellare]
MSTPAKTPAAQAPKTTPPKTVPAAKKSESLAGDSAAATAKDDTVKAIEKIETRQKAINSNNVARVANSHITDPEAKLTPLVSIKTGKALDKFPETSKDIQKLTLVQINEILSQLDTERTGSEQARRERLRQQIGLKAIPA